MEKMIKDYEKVQKHLESAERILRQISAENRTHFDCDHYAYLLSEILECDKGESGLIPMIKSMKAKS